MINLLPPELKQSISYARRNTKLVRWLCAVGVALIGLGLIVGFGQLYLARSISSYSAQAAQAESDLKAQHLDDVQKQVQNISSSLKLAVQVLSKEVLFSKLIQQIGAVMPSKSVLSTIEISQVQGGIDLAAAAQDYQTAAQIQVNLQDPSNKLFDKVDIVSVSCGGSTNSQYPCTVNLRAAFTKNNPFLFINSNPTPAAKP